jgi:putative transposase
MFDLFRLWFGAILRTCCTRRSLLLENLALRQQLVVLKRKHPKPRLGPLDKLFWVVARRFWPRWRQALFLVQPETVVRWHQAGFRLYWAMLCKVRKRVGGGRRITKEIRELIFQMVAENPTWGAPRIHGELLMLGFDVSETTVSRWMRQAPGSPEPAKRWLTFLRNHREAIAAMDFFTVPTLTFNLLHCFFVISHEFAALCTSMSLGIRRAVGLSSSYATLSPMRPIPNSSSLITMQSMASKYPPRSTR